MICEGNGGVCYRAFHRKQLSAVRREVPFLFTKTTTTAHKLGFPDVILPGMVTMVEEGGRREGSEGGGRG